jgi:hypothetical protein
VIVARQFPDTTKPHGSRGRAWVAECQVDGKPYQARSKSGAPYALARALVADGVPDQPMSVVSQGLAGETRYRSLAEMAGRTVVESPREPAYLGRYAAMPESSLREAAE